MTVHCARVAVFLHECGDGAEITAELRWVDGGVLPALPASAYPRDEGGGAEAGFADVPDAFGLVRGVDASGGSCGNGGERGDEGACFGIGFRLGGGAELHDQKPIAGWEELEVFNRFLLSPERIEEISIDT